MAESLQHNPVIRTPAPAGSSAYWQQRANFTKAHFTTVRVPLRALLSDGRSVNLQRLERIRIVFDQRARGQMAVDDIAFQENNR